MHQSHDGSGILETWFVWGLWVTRKRCVYQESGRESEAGQLHLFLTALAFVCAFTLTFPDYMLLYLPFGANGAIKCVFK